MVKYYVDQKVKTGFCGYRYPSQGLRCTFRYDPEKLPYLGLWITAGGFRRLQLRSGARQWLLRQHPESRRKRKPLFSEKRGAFSFFPGARSHGRVSFPFPFSAFLCYTSTVKIKYLLYKNQTSQYGGYLIFTVLVYCIIDISLNNLPVFPSNCVDFAQRCHRIASFSRLVDEKTFCVI